MDQLLRLLFTNNLRKQLIFSVAVVHAILMTLFVWDLVLRQKAFLIEQHSKQAIGLSKSVATSSAGWVAARDLYGLQEIITAQSQYPELVYAMILDEPGQVLAHSDTSKLGKFVADLPETAQTTLTNRGGKMIDAVSPIVLAGEHVGWVRIGLSLKANSDRIFAITRGGVLYSLIAILVGSVMAWLLGTRLTRSLTRIQQAADAVEKGDYEHRTGFSGSDEVSRVGHAFDQMLDSLVVSHRKLQVSEERFDLAMRATDDGVWDWNPRSGDVYFSPSWFSMLGYQGHELEHSFATWERLTDDAGRAKTMVAIEKCLKEGATGFEVEFQMRHKSGHMVDILSRAIAVFGDNGETVRLVGTHVDITEKKQKERLIWQQANFDELTGLPNRQQLHRMLNEEVRHAETCNDSVWLLFLDLDGFKDVNDTLGHQYGDKLLIQASKRISTAAPDAKVVARLSGDEFVVLFSGQLSREDIKARASRLGSVLQQKFVLENDHVFLSASVGIANFPDDSRNPEDLLQYADQAMYDAKKRGKNCSNFFSVETKTALQNRVQTLSDLHLAVRNDEFEIYCQPIVNLKTGNVLKAECLVRWNHPSRGLISPMDFIPLAEESGLIHEIGDIVFHKAISCLQAWKGLAPEPFQLSINMSPRQLTSVDALCDAWMAWIEECGISAEQLVIEVTEEVQLKRGSLANQRLRKFRQAGIQVAIDDFGTGYSSLSYLREFDIDYLKIDRCFIQNISEGNEQGEYLAAAIIDMSHTLGIEVIAEGVETNYQQSRLIDLGCDFAQGYYYSKPVPAFHFDARYFYDSQKRLFNASAL
jgi:diguanylate cyclase (GGDEF)-like protein/PAS domain S-box-containing protein